MSAKGLASEAVPLHALLAVALLLLAPVGAPAADRAPEEQEGCMVEPDRVACVWKHTETFQPSDAVVSDPFEVTLPVFPTTLATFRVTDDGAYGLPEYDPTTRWRLQIVERSEGGERNVANFSNRDAREDDSDLQSDRTVLVAFHTTDSATYHLVASLTLGDFVFAYDAQPPAAGTIPARPAATRDEPHLLGASGDVEPAAFDLTAAWFDDERVGDGLIEARLGVRNLSDHQIGADVRSGAWGGWAFSFSIDDERYLLLWHREVWREDAIECRLDRFLAATGGATRWAKIAVPICEWDETESMLVARLMESSLSNPAAGARFIEMDARAYVNRWPMNLVGPALGSNDPESASDRLKGQRFGFALGGPSVWDELNGCRFCVAEPAWLEAPLSEAHLANTLQVAGAVTATTLFLGGLVLMRHRRRRVRGLLSEVEAVVDAHRADAARGLLALGDLEDSFDARLRRGRITDTEYQIASQRIATAATRLAMRRSLGLDDGAPDAAEVRR